jgi:peptidoglycan/LPS O-acetylase OafA/YrhL
MRIDSPQDTGQHPPADRMTSLDGLRGIAALAVVLLHGSEIYRLQWHPAQAFGAVDFFFLLSGFVLARSYDPQFPRLSPGAFLFRRFTRLYPIVLIGVCLGAAVLAGRALTRHDLGLGQVALDTACALLVLPSLDARTGGLRVFNLDPPLWSLFFELAANLLFALTAMRLRRGFNLALLVGLSGAALAASSISLNQGAFGPVHFPLASFRVLFSFFLGVAFSRSRALHRWKNSLPTITHVFTALALTMILLDTQPENSTTYLINTFFWFPLIVLLSVCARQPHGWTASLMTFAGLLSFPIYTIHHPILRASFNIAAVRAADEPHRIMIFAAVTTAALLMAWLISVTYDPFARGLIQRASRRVLIPASPRDD